MLLKYIQFIKEAESAGMLSTDIVDELVEKTPQQIYQTLLDNGKINPNQAMILIDGTEQKLYYTRNGETILKECPVSTGAKGFGQEPDSGKTPLGLLKIGKKIIAKKYEVLVDKVPTGNILGPNKPSDRVDDQGKKHLAEILTGIIELSSLEPINKTTFGRSIYIHGTNREPFLGQPKSGGCIRVGNDNLLWLAKNIPPTTKVMIYTS